MIGRLTPWTWRFGFRPKIIGQIIVGYQTKNTNWVKRTNGL